MAVFSSEVHFHQGVYPERQTIILVMISPNVNIFLKILLYIIEATLSRNCLTFSKSSSRVQTQSMFSAQNYLYIPQCPQYLCCMFTSYNGNSRKYLSTILKFYFQNFYS